MRYQYLKGEDYFGVSPDIYPPRLLFELGNGGGDQARICINSPEELEYLMSQLIDAADKVWVDRGWCLRAFRKGDLS